MTKKHIFLIIKVLVTIVIFSVIFMNVDIKSTLRYFREYNQWYFLGALLVLVVQALIAAFRWRFVLNGLEKEISYLRLVGFLWIGLFFNQVLPSSVGGDAMRGYYLCRQGFSLGKATIGVLLDRLFGMMGLVFLIVISLVVLRDEIDDSAVQLGVFMLVGSAILAISIALMLDLLPKKLSKWKVMRGLFALSSEGRRQLLSYNPGLVLLLTSFVIHVLSVLTVFVLLLGMQLDINFFGLFVIVPLVGLFMVIPVSISGWGIREGVMIVGLGYLGVIQEQALALSIIYGLSMLVISLPGLICWVLQDNPAAKKSIGN